MGRQTLATSPMMLFARRINHPLEVTVQGSHDAYPRQHRRAAALGDQQQRLRRGLPFRRFVLGLRKLRDVVAGFLERDERAPAGQWDWLVEMT
jgi:hypothetical protein